MSDEVVHYMNAVSRLREEQRVERQEWFERVTALRLALRDLLDAIGDEPCRFDHHGYCQAHFVSSPCEVADARRLLDLDGAHEYRADAEEAKRSDPALYRALEGV